MLPNRTIHLLHVEDVESQRLLLAHHLKAIDGFHFEIRYADSEESAVKAFADHVPDFVILDYHLKQGDGLSCLKQLRARDRIVPIIAISGNATPQITANLLEAGADDYISKRELTPHLLARSIVDILARTDAWRLRYRHHLANETPASSTRI